MSKHLSVAAAGLILSLVQSHATISTIAPFSGSISESWESFPFLSTEPPTYLHNPTSIMGGHASIANPYLNIFQHNYFGLGNSGNAVPVDGVNAVGVNAS